MKGAQNSGNNKAGNNNLEKIYLEASQWVRLANTVIWSMGTLLVPLSFGFVGLALNKAPSTEFTPTGKVLLGFGSVFLFVFWVYASFLYTQTSRIARSVLTNIEGEWQLCEKQKAFYTMQNAVISKWYRLPYAQVIALCLLIMVWGGILWYPIITILKTLYALLINFFLPASCLFIRIP